MSDGWAMGAARAKLQYEERASTLEWKVKKLEMKVRRLENCVNPLMLDEYDRNGPHSKGDVNGT